MLMVTPTDPKDRELAETLELIINHLLDGGRLQVALSAISACPEHICDFPVCSTCGRVVVFGD